MAPSRSPSLSAVVGLVGRVGGPIARRAGWTPWRAAWVAFRAWHPEWSVALVAGLAWSGLIALELTGRGPHGGWAHWTLMSAAMMLPLTLPAARHIGRNSMRHRRRRALVLYTTAYLTVFLAFGVVALAAVAVLGPYVGPAVLVPGVLLLAAGWQVSPGKRRALLVCRRTIPLPPVGRRADAASLRFGLRQGGRCLVICWPVMLLMAVAGHVHVAVMAVLTVALLAEDRSRRAVDLLRPTAVAFAAAAVVLAVSG